MRERKREGERESTKVFIVSWCIVVTLTTIAECDVRVSYYYYVRKKLCWKFSGVHLVHVQ